jgi:hypothetical protein
MEAIEFVAKAEKGSIKIPKKYQEQLHDQFRVIILHETSALAKEAPHKKRTLSAPKISKTMIPSSV